MKLHIVMHENFESPAAIAIWANKKGLKITYTRLYQGDFFPENCNDFDFLIVMGGPQCPKTTVEECPYFIIDQEIKFIKQAIDENKFVLGICLGAQLIGEALGAEFSHSAHKEIGVFELSLTKSAKSDPIFSTFPERFLVGHWHGDMPGLTADAEVLAVSEGCPRQIIRYSSRVYGFQCHFEFTSQAIEEMIEHCGDELNEGSSLPYVEQAEKLRKHDFTHIKQMLYKFLDHVQSRFDLENSS